jgi:F0F1-type ATP synthase membrane subunit a
LANKRFSSACQSTYNLFGRNCLGSAAISVRNPQIILTDSQNFFEYVLDVIQDVSKTQNGQEEYGPWVPFIGTLFLFFFFLTNQVHFYLGESYSYLMGS